MKKPIVSVRIDSNWLSTARDYPEVLIAHAIRASGSDGLFESISFESQNSLSIECWIGALASISVDLVSEYVNHCLASTVDDELKEQACFLGTSVGSEVSKEHLYRQVSVALKQSEKRRVNLSRFLEALYLSSMQIFPELAPLCEQFSANHNQSIESRSSAESVVLLNRGDYPGLQRKILQHKDDGLCCRYYIRKMAFDEVVARRLLDLFESLSIPNQIALIETLCANPSNWVLDFLLWVIDRKEQSGWFRPKQGAFLKSCAVRHLELFSDASSATRLKDIAASNTDLSVDAGCVLLQRFPSNHGLSKVIVIRCVNEIEQNLNTFFVGSPLAKARVRLRQLRASPKTPERLNVM